VRTWPVDAAAPGAPTETGRSPEDVRWCDVGHLVSRYVNELTVALAATRVLQGRLRSKTKAPKDLDQLILEIIGADEHRPRTGGRQLTIPGQQPPPLDTGPLCEHSILRTGLQEDGVEPEEPQPPRERTQHRVA